MPRLCKNFQPSRGVVDSPLAILPTAHLLMNLSLPSVVARFSFSTKSYMASVTCSMYVKSRMVATHGSNSSSSRLGERTNDTVGTPNFWCSIWFGLLFFQYRSTKMTAPGVWHRVCTTLCTNMKYRICSWQELCTGTWHILRYVHVHHAGTMYI